MIDKICTAIFIISLLIIVISIAFIILKIFSNLFKIILVISIISSLLFGTLIPNIYN